MADSGAQRGTTNRPVPLGVQFNSNKAGLDAGNVHEISRVVQEAARGGRFYRNEQRKEEELTLHVNSLRARVAAAPRTSAAADDAVVKIESLRGPCDRTYVCVDFDAFYASVEALDNPSLVGKPHAVGGPGDANPSDKNTPSRGVLSTSSYEARKYGVRSGMPVYIARRLCPDLIIVPARFHRYSELSQLTAKDVFVKYDPSVDMRSLDEAILDMTEYCASHVGTVTDIVEQLRTDVRKITGGLTVSCGVASTRTLAKICADRNKPDGAYHLPASREAITEFCASLPVRKVPGIGKVTERLMKDAFDVHSMGDILIPQKLSAMYHVMTERTFTFLVASALGISLSSTCSPGGVRKSVSRERTFGAQGNSSRLVEVCKDLCKTLASDIGDLDGIEGGRCISIKIKTSDFRVRSRSKTLPGPVRDAVSIQKVALPMLEAELPLEARLLGVRVSALTGPAIETDEIERAQELDRQQTRIDKFFTSDPNRAVSDSAEVLRESNSEGDDSWIPPCPDSQEMQAGAEASDVGAGSEGFHGNINGYICPVCSSAKFHNLVLLNKHVDMCLTLSSGHLSEFESRRLSGGAAKRRRKQSGMDSFVRRVPGDTVTPGD